jgi:hypothetical protein
MRPDDLAAEIKHIWDPWGSMHWEAQRIQGVLQWIVCLIVDLYYEDADDAK